MHKPLHKIDKDIVRYFIPYCEEGFTLFDLSDAGPVVAPFRAFGRFLIVARNQR